MKENIEGAGGPVKGEDWEGIPVGSFLDKEKFGEDAADAMEETLKSETPREELIRKANEAKERIEGIDKGIPGSVFRHLINNITTILGHADLIEMEGDEEDIHSEAVEKALSDLDIFLDLMEKNPTIAQQLRDNTENDLPQYQGVNSDDILAVLVESL